MTPRMELFGLLEAHDYGTVHFGRDAASGMCAIVALHDRRLGPGLGGCRFLEYDNERDAVVDALRLARGMTYKAALAGLPHGGGKSVIIRPRKLFERAALFRAFGRFIDGLGGEYYTAEDSGTGLEDMEVIRSVTQYVVGTAKGSGDPSPFTALGVRRGIEADRRFFADAAHELRTPLAAIQAQAYVVSHSDSEDDRSTALREFDRGISRATQSLAKLLAIARLDARRVEAQLAQGALSDLAGCARSGVIQQASRAERRNITLSYDGANQAWVSVSHEDAATLVENVLDNAVRETPNGGEVRVAVNRIEQAGVPIVELRIEDSGPGIPPDERDRVFERFYRPRTSQSQGSGLGLAIVRRIVELGNGSVAIEDGLAHAEGRGCAIVIRLPALESAPEPIEPDDAPPGMADTRGH